MLTLRAQNVPGNIFLMNTWRYTRGLHIFVAISASSCWPPLNPSTPPPFPVDSCLIDIAIAIAVSGHHQQEGRQAGVGSRRLRRRSWRRRVRPCRQTPGLRQAQGLVPLRHQEVGDELPQEPGRKERQQAPGRQRVEHHKQVYERREVRPGRYGMVWSGLV